MTLILTCVTDDCVYQVSDRRITNIERPGVLIDDYATKAVFIDGRAILGYTGIAKIDGENTDLWLTRVAALTGSGHNMAEKLRKICEEATSAFKRMPFPASYKRHAFRGAGWFSDPVLSGLHPGIVTLHNALQGDHWLGSALDRFELHAYFPPLHRSKFYLTSVGLNPTPDERGAIYQLVRKCANRKERQQQSILEALLRAMRWLHYRYQPNSTVGPNMIAVLLPKAAAERAARTGRASMFAGWAHTDTARFFSVSGDGRLEVDGPHVVNRGVAVSNIKAGPMLS